MDMELAVDMEKEMGDFKMEKLKRQVAKELNCSEDDLIWSKNCLNPKTTYHHEDGTIKGELGYYVRKIK